MPKTAKLLFILFASTALFAQTQAPAPPPQTAREAIVEMITGGEKGIMKHLTVEVQALLSKPENKQGAAMLTTFSALQRQGGGDMKSFAAGSTLLTINEPGSHRKLEVHIDSDDLSGDQDTLQLSLHYFRDGQEQPYEGDEWEMASPHITITVNKQQNVWRLSNIGIGIEFPLGDAEFLKKMFFKTTGAEAAGVGAAAGGVRADLKAAEPKAFDPATTVRLLGYAESSFAMQHPDIGFTCSLPELMETGKTIGVDTQIASGSYREYRWSLSGCQGKPAGSFQVVAEPIAQGRGTQAVCTDATHNLRASEDGRGGTCLSVGKASSIQNQGDGVFVGVAVKAPVEPDQPKP